MKILRSLLAHLVTFNPFRSVTLLGVLVLVVTHIYQAADPTAFTPLGAQLWSGLGWLLTALGARAAVHKAGVTAGQVMAQELTKPADPATVAAAAGRYSGGGLPSSGPAG